MGACLFTLSPVPQGGVKLNDAGPARSLRDLFTEVRAGTAATGKAPEQCEPRRACATRNRPPQDCGGTGVFSKRRGDFGGGTRRAAAL